MAARITQEKIKEIQDTYAKCGVKKKTAELCGVSVSTVTKYLYTNIEKTEAKPPQQMVKKRKQLSYKKPVGADDFVKYCSNAQLFYNACELTKEEYDELEKGIFSE